MSLVGFLWLGEHVGREGIDIRKRDNWTQRPAWSSSKRMEEDPALRDLRKVKH